MTSRRDFIRKTAMASAGTAAVSFSGMQGMASGSRRGEVMQRVKGKDILINKKLGLGGVAMGNGFHENSNMQIEEALTAAWNNGVRYFDTSPWYGLGLSERRLGHFLFQHKRSDYILSTKVGRILEPDDKFTPNPDLLWHGKLNFKHRYDYTAAGVRKSVEDSLHRLGLSSIDMVFVHDLSPDNGDLGEDWVEQFEIAKKGAFPELTKMREEGIIKAWGMGVNTPQPILDCLEVADPDVMLVAIQYSLMEYDNALTTLFPAMEKRGVKAIIGGPFNSGFLANRDRFNYSNHMPEDMLEKRAEFNRILKNYRVDLSSLALQFCAANPNVAAVIPGASNSAQVVANAQSMTMKIPAEVWQEVKEAGLIPETAPVQWP